MENAVWWLTVKGSSNVKYLYKSVNWSTYVIGFIFPRGKEAKSSSSSALSMIVLFAKKLKTYLKSPS